ncbi:MAG: universal stress protein [Archangium gephyra]|uniref:Universal stress protein n=1 Tax=Archangium gephyra TaxID=48 RepID=A0A2W5VL52_9BACT|nr:MAG: universal stress protein [Archangium gephyra]
MKKILVAVDGSGPSMVAARLALELARATGATLTAAYSVAPLVVPGEVAFPVMSDLLAAEQTRGQAVLEDVVKALGAPDVRTLLLSGSPAERLAEVATQDEYDLVVVGSRGRNAVARVLLGSVADRLMHICTRPVLVAR